jgi:hypothetical protein
MGFLTKFGTVWGQIPNTAGRVFWVAPAAGYTVDGRTYRASDQNDGLSPERALLTVDRAWNLVTANVGDVIVLLPGTHSPSASIAADVAGVTMTGLPGGAGNILKQKTTIAAVTGDENINVTAANIEIAYLNIIPVTAISAIDCTSAADNLHIHHCSFDMYTPAANTGTIAIENLETTAGPDFVHIHDCSFVSDGAQGNAIVTGAFLQTVIEDSWVFLSGGTWASAVAVGAASANLMLNNITFHTSGGTYTDVITGTNGVTGGVLILRCNFPVTSDEVDGFTAGDAELNQSFIATVGAGTGGTQVTATT